MCNRITNFCIAALDQFWHIDFYRSAPASSRSQGVGINCTRCFIHMIDCLSHWFSHLAYLYNFPLLGNKELSSWTLTDYLASPLEATVDTGATAAVPPLSCSQTVRVGGNTATGWADLQQIVRLRRLRWHRNHTVAVKLFHFLVLLGKRFLQALIFLRSNGWFFSYIGFMLCSGSGFPLEWY